MLISIVFSQLDIHVFVLFISALFVQCLDLYIVFMYLYIFVRVCISLIYTF